MEWDDPFRSCHSRQGSCLAGGQVAGPRRHDFVLCKESRLDEKGISLARDDPPDVFFVPGRVGDISDALPGRAFQDRFAQQAEGN